MRGDGLHSAVSFSHLLLRAKIRPGDQVVDATCGNGHDTVFLAGLVGTGGRVWSFDVQEEAIVATRELARGAAVLERVELVHGGHEQVESRVTGPVSGVIFNLGYRPGGDKSLITRPETTIPALSQSIELLVPGGILAVVVYPGHTGGDEEARAVDNWAAGLSPLKWHVWSARQINRPDSSPYLVFVEKAAQHC